MPHQTQQPISKSCISCGRTITWRKKWERDWEQVRYCSKACRGRKLNDEDHSLETAILDLLANCANGSSICPSEAARVVAPEGWRELMEPARRAARRLVESGRVEIIQQGHLVEPSTAKGPVRIRLVHASG